MAETENIGFIPRVYEKRTVNNVLDRSFSEFGQTVTESVSKSIEQFFVDYGDLYFQIPASGSTGSHQYLIEKSSEIYNAGSELVDIQPLLDEITQLRSQSVQDQETIIELRQELGQIGSGNSTTT